MGTPRATEATKMVVPNASLDVLEGAHRGDRLLLDRERLSIGRSEWCDLVLCRDPRISQYHALIERHPEHIEIHDLDSRNGIFLEGQEASEGVLTEGSQVRLGKSLMVLRFLQGTIGIHLRESDTSGLLIGSSEAMRKLFNKLDRLSRLDMPVIVTGETGTGKTLMVTALHQQSTRQDGPLVHVNCGAFPPNLVEAQLFGYEKGAFTGADKQHSGYLEQAHGGTLFLDEIGELPLDLQPKLLDAIERKKVRRLGASEEVEVDIRVVAATHRDLVQAVEQKHFREDLYYRLAVVELEMPPLRERPEDLPILTRRLLEDIAPARQPALTPAAMIRLQGHPWRGNVRELRNVLERSIAFLDGELIDVRDLELGDAPSKAQPSRFFVSETLPLHEPGHSSPGFRVEPVQTRLPTLFKPPPPPEQTLEAIEIVDHPPDDGDTPRDHGLITLNVDPKHNSSLKGLLSQAEKQLLLYALEKGCGDVAQAATLLDISKSWCYNLLKRHGIKPSDS